MKKSIAAILFHCSENTSEERRHLYCPRSIDTWCKYRTDQITGKETYKKKINIPTAILEILKPIFSHTDLARDDLLERCVDGETQNANEALNGLIWKRCPKDVFVGKTILEIGVASAVLSFNEGENGLLKVFNELNINPGYYSCIAIHRSDVKRISNMNEKCSEKSKKDRKRLRGVRKGYDDNNVETEGEIYASGAF